MNLGVSPSQLQMRNRISGGICCLPCPDSPGCSALLIFPRDNCRCSVCVNQDTRQRNFNTFELPDDIKPTRLTTNAAGLEIQCQLSVPCGCSRSNLFQGLMAHM
ncbi:hypothetical protein F5B21DRAFT_108726 [Xylaria acuta]|nr:hypothetical protein F5B21DRAFT_108726 [Xylaria acuta]